MALSLSERAQAAQTTLFERYDKLNALWTQAEEELTAIHVPNGVEFSYSSGEDPENPGYAYYSCLGLQKIKGKWRICHGSCSDGRPYVDDWTPITECSGAIRATVGRHLPKFREEVVKSAENFILMVDKGIDELGAALNKCRNDNLPELLAERAKLNGKAK